MKVHIIVSAIALLTATWAFAADQTWKGAISDKMCGADHKKMAGKMPDRECTQACAKGGAPYACESAIPLWLDVAGFMAGVEV